MLADAEACSCGDANNCDVCIDRYMLALKLRPTEMSILLPLGYGGEQTGAAASEAVRGAVAMAMRAARAHMLMNHCGMRNHDRATVNAAKRELREHVTWTSTGCMRTAD